MARLSCCEPSNYQMELNDVLVYDMFDYYCLEFAMTTLVWTTFFFGVAVGVLVSMAIVQYVSWSVRKPK